MNDGLFDYSNIPNAAGSYEVVLLHGHTAYVSGQVSRTATGVIAGQLDADADSDVAMAKGAARVSMQRCLAALTARLGTLDRIEQVLMVRGYVNATARFTRHSEVLDAASQLLIAVLGERGRHARVALGASSLPSGGLTEIEMTAMLR